MYIVMSKRKGGGFFKGNTASEMEAKYKETSNTEKIEKIDKKHKKLQSIMESIKHLFSHFDEHIKLITKLGFLGNIFDTDQKEGFDKNEKDISDEIDALKKMVDAYNKDGSNEDDKQDDIENLNNKFYDLGVLCKFISNGDKIKHNDENDPNKEKVKINMQTRFENMSKTLVNLKLELPKEKPEEKKGNTKKGKEDEEGKEGETKGEEEEEEEKEKSDQTDSSESETTTNVKSESNTPPAKSIIFQIDGFMDPDTKQITGLTSISFFGAPGSKAFKVKFNKNQIKDGKIMNTPQIAKSITNVITTLKSSEIEKENPQEDNAPKEDESSEEGSASSDEDKQAGGRGRKTHRRHSYRGAHTRTTTTTPTPKNTHKTHKTKSRRRLRRRTKHNKITL